MKLGQNPAEGTAVRCHLSSRLASSPRAAWGRAGRVSHGQCPCAQVPASQGRMSGKVREGVGGDHGASVPEKPRHGSRTCFTDRGRSPSRSAAFWCRGGEWAGSRQHGAPSAPPDSDVPSCSGGWAWAPAGTPHVGGSGQLAKPPAADSQKPSFQIRLYLSHAHHPEHRVVSGATRVFWLPGSYNPFLGSDKAGWLCGRQAIREEGNEGYRERLGHRVELNVCQSITG